MDEKKAALRAARQERLRASSSLPKDTTQPVADAKPVADTKPIDKAPVTTAEPKKELIANVIDPTLVGNDANLELVLFNEKTANPHWVAFVNGEPAFKIAYADQGDKEQIKKLFTTPDYATGIKSAVRQFPLTEIMANTNARPYAAVMSESAAFKAIEQKVDTEKTAEYTKKRSEILDNFRNVLDLVSAAHRTNYIQRNPLKTALFDALASAGLENPVPAIEQAFKEASADHFDFMFKQAEKWLGYDAKAFADLKDEIMSKEHQAPHIAEQREIPKHTQRAAALIPKEEDNVPISAGSGGSRDRDPENDKPSTTRTASANGELKSQYAGLFSFRERTLNHDMRGK